MLILQPVDWLADQTSDPASNNVRLYGDLAGGRGQLHTRRPGHRAGLLQNHIGRCRSIAATAQGDVATIDSFGGIFSAVGVPTATAVDTSSFIGGQKRAEILQTTPGTSKVAALYMQQAQFYRGDAAGCGGFHMAFRWGVATGQAATTSAFCGLSSLVTAPTDVDPSTLTDCIGMGWDTADSAIQIMYRTASGTTQKYGLYSGVWPVPTADRSVMFLFELYCPANGSGISWRIEDPVSGAIDFGTLFTDIPAAATMLAPRIYQSVGGVNSVIGITFMNFYAETDS